MSGEAWELAGERWELYGEEWVGVSVKRPEVAGEKWELGGEVIEVAAEW